MPEQMQGFRLLPGPPDACPSCACKHEPDQPHNCQSLHYQYKFYSQRGRWPTWKDAIAHCEPEVRRLWELELKRMGKWSEPESEVPDVLPTPQHTIGTVTVVPIERTKKRRTKRDA